MAAHAILSPSGASRWLACTPSARLEEKFPDSTSTYSEEGTLAHAVGELILRDEPDFKEKLEKLKNSKLGKKYYSDAMYTYADEYAEYVRGFCTGKHFLFIEQKLDISGYARESFGTGDAIIIKDGELIFCDLKYGMGVPVSAVENRQLMLYALGALEEFGFMYDIETVTLNIFQPRLDNISSWSISVEDLEAWAEKELKPKAELAWEGKGEKVAGDHCRFCRAAAQCKALAEHNLDIAKNEFFGQDPDGLMTVEEVAEVYAKSETLQVWVKLLQDFLFKKALDGEKVPGYKLVEGRSTRKYKDEKEVIGALKEAGFKETEFMTEPTLMGLTALQKSIKKQAFKDIVEPMLIKPEGAPVLVPDEDKRPEFHSAETDFKDLIG